MFGAVSLVISLVVAGLVAYLVHPLINSLRSSYKIRKALLKWPGNPPHWLYGNFMQVPLTDRKVRETNPDELLVYFRELNNRYPRGFRYLAGPISGSIVANHPDIFRAATKGKDSKPLSPGMPNYRFVLPWLGYGLLLAGGETWRRNRRLITKAFHFDVLKPYMKIYNEAANTLLSKMSDCESKGEFFAVGNNVSLCTLDILLNCAFSYESNCQIKGDPYVDAVTTIAHAVLERFWSASYSLDFVYKLSNVGKAFYRNCDFVHGISEEVIKGRRAKLNENEKSGTVSTSRKYLDFIDILLSARYEDGNGMTDLEIRNEVDTFLFEGHDTTASSLTWMMYTMATNPEHQTKVQQEIDELMEGRDSDEIMWEDLGKLTYLVQCLKETMRVYPPVPMIQRVLEKDLTIDGKTILAGTTMEMNIYALHHNPEVWPDSLKFIPDRFSPDNIKNMDPFAFLPFSAGPRNCVGQNFALNEEKVIIARILRKFTLELDPEVKVVPSLSLVMRTKDELKIKLKKRF